MIERNFNAAPRGTLKNQHDERPTRVRHIAGLQFDGKLNENSYRSNDKPVNNLTLAEMRALAIAAALLPGKLSLTLFFA